MKFSTVDPYLKNGPEGDVIQIGDLTIHHLYLPGTIHLGHFAEVKPVTDYLKQAPPLDDEHQLILRVILNEHGALTGAVIAYSVTDDGKRTLRAIICFLSEFIDDLGGHVLPLVNREAQLAQERVRIKADELSHEQNMLTSLIALRGRIDNG